MLTIEHVFPEIGRREIRVFGCAEKLHHWLNDNRILKRLSDTPQLGMANVHFPEFRHSRLDYTYLILLIIDILKDHSTEFRLNLSNSRKYVVGGTDSQLSGAEIMQSWAMLLNMGHMHDTFFAESLLHQHFVKHWEDIAPHFRSPWTRATAKTMLSDSDYRFHYLLALLELERLEARSRLYKPMAFLIALYRSDDIPRLKVQLPAGTAYLRRAYKVIRRVAYLALDTYYSRCPFGLSIAKLTSILPRFIRRLLDEDPLLTQQLDSISEWLGDRYYCSPRSVVTMVENTTRVHRSFAKSLAENKADKSKFLELIGNWKRETPAVHPSSGWVHVIRIPVRPPDNANTNSFLPTVIRQSNYTLSVVNVGSGSSYYLDIFAQHTPNPYPVLALIPRPALLTFATKLGSEPSFQYPAEGSRLATYRERWRLIRHQCADHFYRYVDAVFTLLGDEKSKDITFALPKGEGLGWLLSHSRDDLQKDFQSYIETDFARHASGLSQEEADIRKRELCFTKDVVDQHLRGWEQAAVFTGSVVIHDARKGPVTDIDGLALLVRDKDIRCLLLQHKTSASGRVSQAKKWFKTKVKPHLPKMKGAGRHRIHEYSEGIAISIDFKAE